MIADFRFDHFWLSNFYPVEFLHRGILFKNSEAAFMWHKSDDPEYRAQILAASTAREARNLGRKCVLRPDWEQVKVRCMMEVCFDKFLVPEMKAKLQATGDEVLMEGNHWGDRFWGCEKVSTVGGWEGQNYLGRSVMANRALQR